MMIFERKVSWDSQMSLGASSRQKWGFLQWHSLKLKESVHRTLPATKPKRSPISKKQTRVSLNTKKERESDAYWLLTLWEGFSHVILPHGNLRKGGFFFQIDDETQAQMKKFRDLPQVTRQNPSTPGFPLESVCHWSSCSVYSHQLPLRMRKVSSPTHAYIRHIFTSCLNFCFLSYLKCKFQSSVPNKILLFSYNFLFHGKGQSAEQDCSYSYYFRCMR